MGFKLRGRRGVVVALFVCLLLLFLSLGTLNAFNLSVLNPDSPLQTLVFIALSVLAFLLFVAVLVLLVRNVLKLYADQRSQVLGTRLRTRMLSGAVLVSLVPLVFMFLFSYLLMNRSVDRWFSQPVVQMREDADKLASDLFLYAAANSRSEADSIAARLTNLSVTDHNTLSSQDISVINHELEYHSETLLGGFAIVYHDANPIVSFHAPDLTAGQIVQRSLQTTADNEVDGNVAVSMQERRIPGTGSKALLSAARQNNDAIYSTGGTDSTTVSSFSSPCRSPPASPPPRSACAAVPTPTGHSSASAAPSAISICRCFCSPPASRSSPAAGWPST